MLPATGGGSNASAFGGVGRGVVEEREKGGRAGGSGKVATGTACGGILALGKAPEAVEKGGKKGGIGGHRGLCH